MAHTVSPLLNVHYRYPIAQLKRLSTQRPYACQLGENALVAWRHVDGIALLPAYCPHRQFPLKNAKLCNGYIVCPWHQWAFDHHGVCRHIPGISYRRQLGQTLLPPYPVMQHQGLLWTGLQTPTEPLSLPVDDWHYLTQLDITASAIDLLAACLSGRALPQWWISTWQVVSCDTQQVTVFYPQTGVEAYWRYPNLLSLPDTRGQTWLLWITPLSATQHRLFMFANGRSYRERLRLRFTRWTMNHNASTELLAAIQAVLTGQ